MFKGVGVALDDRTVAVFECIIVRVMWMSDYHDITRESGRSNITYAPYLALT